MTTLIDFLTESIPFVDEYLIKTDDNINKRNKKHVRQFKRIIDPIKWREYLQVANGKL